MLYGTEMHTQPEEHRGPGGAVLSPNPAELFISAFDYTMLFLYVKTLFTAAY